MEHLVYARPYANKHMASIILLDPSDLTLINEVYYVISQMQKHKITHPYLLPRAVGKNTQKAKAQLTDVSSVC